MKNVFASCLSALILAGIFPQLAGVPLRAAVAEPPSGSPPVSVTPSAAGLPAAAAASSASVKPTPAEVLSIMEKAANWQLAHPASDAKDGWIQSAFYAGAMALGRESLSDKYFQAMLDMAAKNNWKQGSRQYHADDQAVGQTYLELYEIYQKPEMIVAVRARFDSVMASPKDDDLNFSKAGASDKWSWCDALFMDPPAWARLAKITGDKKYLDFANRLWWVTSDYLYDKTEHLYFRDSTYFTQKEPNGQKLFWSRGNGWVMGGLVRMLQYMPLDYPDRPKYVAQFKEMAEKLKSIQQSDGLWRPGLLDPVAHPEKETSGTGFDTYAMAWGINEGILDRATYEPVVLRAWNALVQCVGADGKVGNVQPVGAAPKAFDASSTTPYGVGAFLLAGSEVYKLVGGKVPEKSTVPKAPGA